MAKMNFNVNQFLCIQYSVHSHMQDFKDRNENSTEKCFLCPIKYLSFHLLLCS